MSDVVYGRPAGEEESEDSEVVSFFHCGYDAETSVGLMVKADEELQIAVIVSPEEQWGISLSVADARKLAEDILATIHMVETSSISTKRGQA
ncbi:MAG: hypothetical protein E6Q97_01565 [Desulfurellales bacterium]|nr:MAG: hypothetical protein E6Q97_01565 [Desulfurellales bacterium]